MKLLLVTIIVILTIAVIALGARAPEVVIITTTIYPENTNAPEPIPWPRIGMTSPL